MRPDSDLNVTLDVGLPPRGMAVYGATARPDAMGVALINRMLPRSYDGNLVQGPQEPVVRRSAALRNAAASGEKLATFFSSNREA